MEALLPALSARPRSGWAVTVTERNWLASIGISIAFMAALYGVGSIERASHVREGEGLVRIGAEAAARFLAVSHTLVATAFLASSRRVRTPRGAAWFVAMLGLGVVACLAFSGLGGMRDKVAATLFYTYFLFHDFRDEVFFYRVNGDAPAARTEARVASLIPWIAFAALTLVFVAGAALEIGGARRFGGYASGWSLPTRVAFVVGCGALAAGAVAIAARRMAVPLGRLGPVALWRTHGPMVRVFLGIALALFVGIVLTRRMYTIVVLHVVLWYVFTARRLRAAPPPRTAPRPFTWTWMRTTLAGFNVLHLGILGLVMGLAGLHAYGFHNATDVRALHWMVSEAAFPYWTLMHVTLSWVPR